MKKVLLNFADTLLSREQMRTVKGGDYDGYGDDGLPAPKCKCIANDHMDSCGRVVTCSYVVAGKTYTYTLSRAQSGNKDCEC